MSTYPRRPKAKAFSNAVDVVEHLHDPTDPSTDRTAPPCSAHVQLDDVPRTLDPVEAEGEFRQHDGVAMVMMKLPAQGSPKHYNDMTEVCNCGGGHCTRLKDQLVCSRVPPPHVYKGGRGSPVGPRGPASSPPPLYTEAGAPQRDKQTIS